MTDKPHASQTLTPPPKQDLRPPALTHTRGTGATFDFGQVIKDYYGPMRFFGYASSVFMDMFVDHRLKNDAALKADPGKRAERKEHYSNLFSKIETVYFGALTTIYAVRDWKDMRRYFRGALAAEKGVSPNSVGDTEMRQSNNPIIKTALRRFTWMNVVRGASDLLFLKSLNVGLLGMYTRITFERTLFSQKTAYDKLEALFENVQAYGFDIQSKEKVAKELASIVQQIQKDHQRQPWSRELMLHYMPLFDAMGDAITRKQFGLTDSVYLLGELITQRLTLENSQALLQQIHDHGLDSLRKQKPLFTQEQIDEPRTPAASAGQLARFMNPLSGEALQRLALNGPVSLTKRAEKKDGGEEMELTAMMR